MDKPKAILFDYGHTLIYETKFDLISGGEALYDVMVGDIGISRDDFAAHVKYLYNELGEARRSLALELPAVTLLNVLRDYYGITFSLSDLELEELFWDSISPPLKMDGTTELLEYLANNQIRTGVISNLWYRKEVLKRRIDRLIPDNSFEIVISSSEYGFRKPNKLLFDIALKKMGLQACDTWFVGDEPASDIDGAYSAGITPILITPDIPCPYKFKKQSESTIDAVRITTLNQLQKLVESHI